MKKIIQILCIGFAYVLTSATANAALNYDQNIVAIFGSGNPDTGWTTATDGGIVLALRAKNRENASTANLSGVYAEPVGYQAPANTRARWNWEFSIDSGSANLDAYDYYVGIDQDYTTGINLVTVNALTSWGDNSYGTAATLNGQGLEGPSSTYASVYTIAQQSQNITFAPSNQDPTLDATYSYVLYAVPLGAGPNGTRIATVAITVVVGAGGPLPPDDDGDGVPNSIDQCSGTATGEAVDANGCSIQDFVNKCAAENSADHGEYVSCVVELANGFFKQGKITQAERKYLINSAAQSDIGK